MGLDISAELEVPIGNWQLTILLMDDEGTISSKVHPKRSM